MNWFYTFVFFYADFKIGVLNLQRCKNNVLSLCKELFLDVEQRIEIKTNKSTYDKNIKYENKISLHNNIEKELKLMDKKWIISKTYKK